MAKTPKNSDRYFLRDLLADFRSPQLAPALQNEKALALAAVPKLSYPFRGNFPVTQYFTKMGHAGVDWGMPYDTPLYAAHGGYVVKAGWDVSGYGYMILIENAGGFRTLYGHLNGPSAVMVKVGDRVTERQQIGRSGSTGNSTGPHLHFEVRVSPYRYRYDCVNPFDYIVRWTETPPPTGGVYEVVKDQIGVFRVPNKDSGPVAYLRKGTRIVCQSTTIQDPSRIWLYTQGTGIPGYVMEKNKAKLLLRRVSDDRK